jgi:uncharacterized protein (TIGR02246 family)
MRDTMMREQIFYTRSDSMVDRAAVAAWLDAYVQAWKTYDQQAIRNLFAEDATYRFHPFDKDVVRGREAIVANWLENPDPPGTWQAEYVPVAVEGNTAVAEGRTRYFEADGKTLTREFGNIFVMRFDDQGRCAEFTEWFMQPRGQ